jgi:hypothetical protein
MVEPGKTATYSVSIEKQETPYELAYSWSVSAGEIVSGQGTKQVTVVQPNQGLTLTVEVKGLPEGCPFGISETSVGDPSPEAVKIGVVRVNDLNRSEEGLNEFADILNNNPNNQGYVLVGHPPSTSEAAKAARERKIAEKIIENLNGRDQSRVTLVRYENASDFAEFWRVPPGAHNPDCEVCKELSCPAITIIGPEKPISPGTVAIFSVNSDLKKLEGLKFEWGVSIGTIVDGHGTHSIQVRVPEQQMLQALEVGVTVAGLPAGCKETTFTRAEPTPPVEDPIILDEFGILSAKEEMRRLDIVVNEWKRHPAFVLYFVLRRAKHESLASQGLRIRRIKDYLFQKRKLPPEKVLTFSGGVGRRSTQIYLVQP